MNTNDHQAELVAKVQDLGSQLDHARADVALLRRLKAAEADEKRLAADLRTAQEELAEANAAQIKAERDARFALFHDIKVVEKVPAEGSAIVHMQYEITLTKTEFDGRQSAPVTRVIRDFRNLPEYAVDYLIEVHPERVPESIRALDPENLWNAFDRFFVALKRGMQVTYA